MWLPSAKSGVRLQPPSHDGLRCSTHSHDHYTRRRNDYTATMWIRNVLSHHNNHNQCHDDDFHNHDSQSVPWSMPVAMERCG